MEISAVGAVLGLAIAIILIVYRVAPAYSLIAGAFVGGLIGGAMPDETIKLMIQGTNSIIPATLRILTAGVLAGVLIESGAAARIAKTIIQTFGESQALLALAVATMLLTAVGVFIDIAVITVSPIALALIESTGSAQSASLSKSAALIAMIGGGKSGNVISPNPNTIAASEIFEVELFSLMAANFIPALFGLAATVLIARLYQGSSSKRPQNLEEFLKCSNAAAKENNRENDETLKLPPFWAAILGPATTILLLALRPISKLLNVPFVEIDPMIALPVGGIVGCVAMGKARQLNAFMTSGLQRMTGVAILLLGTGAIAGIIKGSTLSKVFVSFLNDIGLPGVMLAPISGILMSAATASTTAGTIVASSSFHDPLLAAGVSAMAAAAMIHAGATVLDHLPHGSFFHATGGAVGMSFGERLRVIPFETAIGLVLVIVSTVIYGVLT